MTSLSEGDAKMLYTYKMPTELFFGRGASEKIGERVKQLGSKSALVVTDKGVLKTGILGKIESSLNDYEVKYTIFSDIYSDPDVSNIVSGLKIFNENHCDIAIGIGGGSAMDTAKAIAAMANNPGECFDYIGIGKMRNPSYPVIAVPTTAGTGSEATYWAVLTDRVNKVKAGIGGWNLMPTLAIIDPVLTISLPPAITASTGMDALTHAIESYVSKASQPVSEGLAIQAIKMIARSLRRAYTNGEDLDAREDMIMGSLIAAMAFNVTRLGNAHALAAPLGVNFNIPHGICNAILLPHVMEFNYLASPHKHIEIAKIFDEKVEGLPESEAAHLAVFAIKKLMRDIDIVSGLSDYGVMESDLMEIAKEAHSSGNVKVNPRVTSVDNLIKILTMAMRGL